MDYHLKMFENIFTEKYKLLVLVLRHYDFCVCITQHICIFKHTEYIEL